MNQNRDMFPVAKAQAKQMELLDCTLLNTTPSAKEAVKMMVAYAGSTQEAIANEMGKDQESISRFINGNRGMNINDFENFINACGNLYLIQFLAFKFGYKLTAMSQNEQEILELEHQLAMKRRAA